MHATLRYRDQSTTLTLPAYGSPCSMTNVESHLHRLGHAGGCPTELHEMCIKGDLRSQKHDTLLNDAIAPDRAGAWAGGQRAYRLLHQRLHPLKVAAQRRHYGRLHRHGRTNMGKSN